MITLPSVDDFYIFWGDAAEEVDSERAETLIELSADLLWLATNIDKDPVDPRLAQLVRYAICDMAIYIYVTRDEINESYSPFVSERVGSYSYSKNYGHLSRAVIINEPTGVPLFDKVVSTLLDDLTYGDGTIVGGQQVAREDYVPLPVEVHHPRIDQDVWRWGPYGGPYAPPYPRSPDGYGSERPYLP